MVAATLPSSRGPDQEIAFRILGQDGLPATGYAEVQTKKLHFYLVRDDLSGYQHLHPGFDGTTWRTRVSIADGGAYRIYAEFIPLDRAGSGHPTVLGLPFLVPGDTKFVPLPPPSATASSGGYTVTRLDGVAHVSQNKPAVLRFDITGPGGGKAQLEQYLGAYAHLSSFEVLNLRLTHMHPIGQALVFHAVFAQRGEQRMFLQFQVGGQVHLAEFTVFVT